MLTVSESIRKTLLNSGIRPNLVETVYEGIDPDWNDAQKPAALPFCKDALVVGTVAHLSQEKGHVDILKAISLVRDKCPEACFVFVNDYFLNELL